jgi:pilus assembly protein CpaB
MFRTARSRRVAFGVFFTLFVLWGVAAFWLASQMRSQLTEEAAEAPAPLVVATRSLPAYTRLAESDVRAISVPESAKHPDAATALEEVIGLVVTRQVIAGEPILLSTLGASETGGGLAVRVPSDMRAISVSYSDVIGAGGLIKPGDLVDVIAGFNKSVLDEHQAGYVVLAVRVLAVERHLVGAGTDAASEEESGDDAGQRRGVETRTVTMAVTPDQAQRLALADLYGELKLVLRAPDDSGSPLVAPVTADEVFVNGELGERRQFTIQQAQPPSEVHAREVGSGR